MGIIDMRNQEIPIHDEQEQDERILIVVRVQQGVACVAADVNDANLIRLVVIDDDAQDEDTLAENRVKETYLAQFNLTYLPQMTVEGMQEEDEAS